MTVEELGERMGARELTRWEALYAMEEEERQTRELQRTVTHELATARTDALTG